MKKCLILFVFFGLVSRTSAAQIGKFGIYTRNDWDLKNCVFDPAAGAFILFDVGAVTISPKYDIRNYDISCPLKIDFFELSFKRNLRIKVLDTAALEYDKLSFTLKKLAGLNDRLSYFKCIIAWQENGKTKKIQLNQKDLAEEKGIDEKTIMTCTFPGIRDECLIDIEYSIVSNIFNELPEWDFFNRIPSNYSEYCISIPDFLIYERIKGLVNFQTSDELSQKSKCGIWYTGTDGNYTYKDYEFHIDKSRFFLNNIMSYSASENDGQLRHVLKANNIDKVFGTAGKMIRYPKNGN